VLFGRTIVFKLTQSTKALFKLVIVHPDGIVIDSREIQLSNINTIVIVAPTVVGKVSDVNL
jgi:hypothetical protein